MSETAYLPEPACAASQVVEGQRDQRWLWAAILVLAAAVPYVSTLGYGFVYDDGPQIVENRDLLSLKSVPGFFTHSIEKAAGFHGEGLPVFYRPLFFVQLCLTRVLFGAGPFGFHLVSLLFHMSNTLLVYAIAVRLGVRQAVGRFAGLLFAVHPVHVECVVWPSASPDLMVLAAMLVSVLSFINSQRARASRARYGWLAASLTAFLAALFVKETAMATVPILAAIAFMETAAVASRVRRITVVLSPYIGLTFFYLLVRKEVLHGLVATVTPIPLREMARTWPNILWFYERHLVMPTRVSLLYDYDLVEHATLGAFWIPLMAVVASLVLFAFWARRNHSPAVAIATLLVVLPIPMVLNFRLFNWRDLVHDRYLYTPSAGFCILAAIALLDLGSRAAKMIGPLIQRALAVGLLCFLALTTVTQAMPWRNNLLLLEHAVEVAPGNIASELLLGNEFEVRGNFEEAKICYTRAVQLTPAWGPAWFAYGRTLLLTRDPNDAIRSLQHAIELDESPIASVWLALALDQVGRPQEAQLLLAKAESRDPSMSQVYARMQRQLLAAPASSR
jgi:hypothetical protein